MGGHLSTSPPLDAREVVPVLLTSTNTSTNLLDTGLVTVTPGCRRAARGAARRGGRAGVDGPQQAPPPRLERGSVAVAAR